MSSTFSESLRLELMADGENKGTWGQKTNINLGTLLETAIAGVASITMSDANKTLTALNGADDESRHAVLVLTGVLTAARQIIIPGAQKTYIVKNSTTGGFSLNVKTASGAAAEVKNGTTSMVFCDGTNCYKVDNGFQIGVDVQAYSALLTAIAALTTTDGNFIVGNGTTWVAESGATARTSLGSAASGANSDITSLSGLTTPLSAAQGGTGKTSFTVETVNFGATAKAPFAGAADTAGTANTANAVPTGTITSVMLNDALITGLTSVTPTTSDMLMVADESDTGKLKKCTVMEAVAAGINASGDAPIYAARAWVNFNGSGTVAINGSGNVSSITDVAAGKYGLNFTTQMPHINYATLVTGKGVSGDPNRIGGELVGGTKTVNRVDIQLVYTNDVYSDSSSIGATIFC